MIGRLPALSGNMALGITRAPSANELYAQVLLWHITEFPVSVCHIPWLAGQQSYFTTL